MTTTFAAQQKLARVRNFQDRVQQAMIKTALAIQSEDPETANHINRSAFALSVLRNPQASAELIASGVASQIANDKATDLQVESALSAIWNAYAGVL